MHIENKDVDVNFVSNGRAILNSPGNRKPTWMAVVLSFDNIVSNIQNCSRDQLVFAEVKLGGGV